MAMTQIILCLLFVWAEKKTLLKVKLEAYNLLSKYNWDVDTAPLPSP